MGGHGRPEAKIAIVSPYPGRTGLATIDATSLDMRGEPREQLCSSPVGRNAGSLKLTGWKLVNAAGLP